MIAFGGSRIGIGTDVAGSVRIPAHFCGIYSIKSSIGRFPKQGPTTSMPGQEGVPAICAPMAKTLEDLEMFWKAVVSMHPWEYDHSVRFLVILRFLLSTHYDLWSVIQFHGGNSPCQSMSNGE